MKILKRATSFLILALSSLGLAQAQAIKTFPLDEHLVYHLKVSPDKPTTIMFPGPITDLEGSGITTDPKVPAKVLLSYHPGERFFSLRALISSGTACLNVIANHKTYVLEMVTDPVPFQSVTFYDSPVSDGLSTGHRSVDPDRLLALLDEAKAYPLLKDQYPEVVAQIDHAEPLSPTLYPDFTVVLTSVYRFDPEDTLIFQLELQNQTDHPIYYVPQSLAIRVGPQVYWSALADASGVMPPGHFNPGTGKIEPSHCFAYFVICGSPQGGRNHLAVTNHFNVFVFRQEKP
jgi:hypothetical protein